MGLFFDLPSRPGQGSQLFPPPIAPDPAILAAGRQECAVKALAIFATLAIFAAHFGGRSRYTGGAGGSMVSTQVATEDTA